MDSRNYTDVIIAGKVYTLGGYESEEYLQRIAGYLNGKNSELRKIDGFLRQTPDYQNILMQLNVADDYFKAAEELAEVKETAEAQEKELYALKHQLVTVQMKLEKLRSKMDQIEEASRGNHTDGTNTD
ncbi:MULTISPECIES: cell division protein ZapA [unclassified Candidatus Paralachnospira]|uniref:cell division protein ZapA n=1 Tax=unclassified Candidatus Paralachnospira TaxID=3099471 RepID=UPI003F929C08